MLEKMEARMKELLAQRQRAIADVNAYDGAIQECRHWMSVVAQDQKQTQDSAMEV